MKILFIMTDPGHLKYYFDTLRYLLKQGHTLHMGFFSLERKSQGMLYERLQSEFPDRFSYKTVSTRRRDLWQDLCSVISGVRDYLFFLKPLFVDTPRLRERVEIRISSAFIWIMNNVGFFRSRRVRDAVDKSFKWMDEAIPAAQSLRDYVRSVNPDVMLLSPLLAYSMQTEYLRAGHDAGIPTAHCVASWDNLTTKGALRGGPDYQILWNDLQKQEAIELHDMKPEQIIVTGAQYFDEWFVRQPSRSREDFCRAVGLPAEKPILLYLCSTNFIAPNEKSFVFNWLQALRRSGVPGLSDCGVIIRPYPEYFQQWRDADLGDYGNVVVWPTKGEYPVTEDAKTNFFESVYYSMGVVGVNTTAMIESAIVGKCVFSVLDPELNDSQAQTIHFRYLRRENGGMLFLAKDLDEHVQQLREVMENEAMMRSQVAQFVERFARPHGLDKPAVPILAEAIETVGNTRVLPSRQHLGSLLARGALFPLAIGVKILRLVNRRKRKSEKVERDRALLSAANQGSDPLKSVWQSRATSKQDGPREGGS